MVAEDLGYVIYNKAGQGLIKGIPLLES